MHQSLRTDNPFVQFAFCSIFKQVNIKQIVYQKKLFKNSPRGYIHDFLLFFLLTGFSSTSSMLIHHFSNNNLYIFLEQLLHGPGNNYN